MRNTMQLKCALFKDVKQSISVWKPQFARTNDEKENKIHTFNNQFKWRKRASDRCERRKGDEVRREEKRNELKSILKRAININ